MADSWQILVFDNQHKVCTSELVGSVVLGRQRDEHETMYAKSRMDSQGRWRLVIASRYEDSVSRDHALIETPAVGNVAKLKNISNKVPIRLNDGTELNANASCELELPTVLTLGRKIIRIVEQEEIVFQGLPEATSPGASMATPSVYSSLTLPPSGDNIQAEEMIRWLKAAMDVLQSSASSSDFFEKAARAVVENVGLDTGRVVLLQNDNWQPFAYWAASGVAVEKDQIPSRSVLARVRRERRTLWATPDAQSSESLMGVTAVVASPILDEKGDVIGVLYGDRRKYRGPGLSPRITKLDAMLVELLGNGVASGLARMGAEKNAMEARIRFEQFFTPELANQMSLNSELLKGQDSEITLLFCDIRGFSRISERLGPARTLEWINDVMEVLSDCVIEHHGVLVDYIGDELMAMWGAPVKQPDHPVLACRAALDMIRVLPQLNARWQAELGEPLDVGIGINTGEARVGNTGCQRKFKYGPLGNMVNIASRVQGVTKYLKVRILVTEETKKQLDQLAAEESNKGLVAHFSTRRIGKVRVVNIAAPVYLYELAVPGSGQFEAMRLEYESALEEFERENFNIAARILANLLGGDRYDEHHDDGPSLVLLSRVVNSLVDSESFDAVFTVPGK